jgi:hypothetical protein
MSPAPTPPTDTLTINPQLLRLVLVELSASGQQHDAGTLDEALWSRL